MTMKRRSVAPGGLPHTLIVIVLLGLDERLPFSRLLRYAHHLLFAPLELFLPHLNSIHPGGFKGRERSVFTRRPSASSNFNGKRAALTFRFVAPITTTNHFTMASHSPISIYGISFSVHKVNTSLGFLISTVLTLILYIFIPFLPLYIYTEKFYTFLC